MKAIVAYINFLGSEVPKGKSPAGSGIWEVPFPDRAADPDKGKLTYQQKCVSCHGATGQGIPNPEGTVYTFPPLWGTHSYNQGAACLEFHDWPVISRPTCRWEPASKTHS